MSADLRIAVRELVHADPRLAIVIAEILGTPVGSPDAPPRLWDG